LDGNGRGLIQILFAGAKESREIPKSELTVPRPRFEPRTSQIHVWNVTVLQPQQRKKVGCWNVGSRSHIVLDLIITSIKPSPWWEINSRSVSLEIGLVRTWERNDSEKDD
jgi:hypothetical protein